jgi:hypothetical protein
MKHAIFANRRRACAALLVVLTLLPIIPGSLAVQGQTYPGKIGIGIGDGRALFLTDAARTFREWRSFGVNQAAPLDEQGWPATDAWTVIFDYRPTNAWNFPAQFIDDPERYQVNVFGTYLVSFNGSADLTAGGVATVSNIVYDPDSNTTTAEVNVLRAEITPTNNGSGLLILNFRNTRRTPESSLNSGITNLRVLRPGVSRESTQVLTSAFISALRPFSVVRFMDFLETNHRIFYGTGDWIDWADRRKVTDATQESTDQTFGYAWEYVALIGNLSNRDLWINIPAEASDEYITELARLMRDRINPDLNLYLEYSNEVWNFGFGQYVWNKAAARDEVCDNYAAPFTTQPPCTQISTTSNLNIPDVSANTGGGRPNREEIWARRRHARRTKEIGDKFREIFCEDLGAGAAARIRPVLSWWAIQPQEYDEMLQWLRAQYGDPSQYLYGIATTAYFGVGTAIFQNPAATVEEILAAMETSLNNSDGNRQRFIDVARAFNIKAMTYESGSATGDVNSQFIFETNIANRIRAERSQRNGEFSRSNLADHWFNLPNGGGDLFMQFALVSAYNRFGSWGLTDDIADVNRNFKYAAVAGLSGTLPLDAPVGLRARAGNKHVKLSWEPVEGATGYHVRRGGSPWGPFIMIGRNVHSPRFNDVGLKNGRTYYYVVSSVNDSQVTPAAEGTNSNPPLAVTPRKRHPSRENRR